MRVQIHAARSWPCTREHTQRRMRGLIDTHRARLWPCMWGHSHAAAHMPRHSTAVHMWTHMWAHAALTMQGHKRAHTHVHARTRAHGGGCRHTPPSKCHRAARPRAEHPPAVTSPRGRDPKQAACPQLPGAPGGQGVGGGEATAVPGEPAAGACGQASLARRGCVTRALTHRYLWVLPLYIAPRTPHLLAQRGGWWRRGGDTHAPGYVPPAPPGPRGQVAPRQPRKSQRWPEGVRRWWHRATWQGPGWQGQHGRHEGSSRSL